MQKEKKTNKIVVKFYLIVVPREMKKVNFPPRTSKEAQNFIFQTLYV